MTNFEPSDLRSAPVRANPPKGLVTGRPVGLLATGAVAILLMLPLPLRAQTFGSTAPMGQLPQLAVGQQYQLSPDTGDPDHPPQFQPVPNDDSDDSSMNSDDDNNSDDNADNADNDQNQSDDTSGDAPADDTPPPPPPTSN
jgi:hypothetical protein